MDLNTSERDLGRRASGVGRLGAMLIQEFDKLARIR
jgi:hypothetical protein